MTLTAYLGLLSLGSIIQTRHSAECQQEEQQELEDLRDMAQYISAAEIDTVATVSIPNAPSERKVEMRENITGVMLAISTMVANYSLCFPVVAARHRLQALPTRYSYYRDTPLFGAKMIIYTYKNGGIRRLYPGFGLGLIGQTLSASYESGLNHVIAFMMPPTSKASKPMSVMATLISKALAMAIHVPLYPLYRNALILRVQSDSDLTNIVIRNSQDFMRFYKRDLEAFWPSHPNNRHVLSALIPSCILNAMTEKLLIYIYRRIFQYFSFNDDSSTNVSKKKKDATVLHTFYPEIACGVISSIITRALSYPIDTIIFKLMVQHSGVLKSDTTYHGFFDCVKRTWLEEGGWKAFYPGWGIGILEMGVGYLILEASWWAYCATQWKLTTLGSSDTRAVRKAKKLRERLSN
ncbi:mitochondrial carrier domain-containing protein [Gilbertella persicaria]|uniref:mitochondrial carrier domain-containing protein n=1 Tax=Gilbertella persicaria TaxID=101096 RepID=UPI002220BB22|nr:mitochondrial carrier domain-containing protein [Gilbertella persicaria]KAI8081893.1 mitochondrial carrier domain-containing protein [Gilbertella persicaria]